MNQKVIVTSGYYNPIHAGHIRYLKAAKDLGDYHIAIVNNDLQVKLKGSVPFMNQEERMEILRELRCIDLVFLSIDTDRTQCTTLVKLARHEIGGGNPMFFVKGGDRLENNIPEVQICKQMGIELVFGIGGEKIQSSSDLLKKIL